MKCSNCQHINKKDVKYCEKCRKKINSKTRIIFLVINYIAISIIYALIGHIFYLSKTSDGYTAAVEAWVYYYVILFGMIIILPLLIGNLAACIKDYKMTNKSSNIINIAALTLLYIPIIIGILKIYN